VEFGLSGFLGFLERGHPGLNLVQIGHDAALFGEGWKGKFHIADHCLADVRLCTSKAPLDQFLALKKQEVKEEFFP